MKGQWIGRYEGTNVGDLIVELDEMGDHFEGRVYAYDDNIKAPSSFAFIRTPGSATEFDLEVGMLPIDPDTAEITEWRLLASKFPGMEFPTKVQTHWKFDGDDCFISWKSDVSTSGAANVKRSNADRPSDLEPLAIKSWDAFRNYFRQQDQFRFVYRGQETNQWRLRTSFHRSDRNDLLKYLLQDLQTLHGSLSSLTTHFFQLLDPIQNAAFVSLIQHHGYPTPLLDWTYSPFIAAYFAFKKAKPDTKHVRIFMFDAKNWSSDWNQLRRIQPARPHFSMTYPVSLNNPRLVPQQALSTVTNMEDIEAYIASKERADKKYLFAVDLPFSERLSVLKELSAMGIGPGSLFPGFEGACAQVRERFFGIE